MGGVAVDQLNATSGVRQHLSKLRAAGKTNDEIALDPLMREYMRFFMQGLTEHWNEIATAAKDVARMANRSLPAAYGNLGGGVTSNYSRPCGLVLHQSVDVIWNEETGSLAGQREESASLSLKLSEAAGSPPLPPSPSFPPFFLASTLTAHPGACRHEARRKQDPELD